MFDTIGGVLFAKLVNVFLAMAGKKPVNPMIGGCGISAAIVVIMITVMILERYARDSYCVTVRTEV